MAALIDPYKKSTPGLNSPNANRTFSTSNPGASQPKQAAQQNNPYRGGLQTEFTGDKKYNTLGEYQNSVKDNDSDVAGAKNASFYLGAGYNEGVDSGAYKALLNMYTSRINQKNSLAEAIAGNESGRKNMIDQIYGESGRALGEGLKKTKENYSSRGLLYSGMREGSEQDLKSGIAAKTASDVTSANRESANALESAKRAYASVGLQNAQQNIDLANQAFETANQNSIARLQAYQQFGYGLGAAGGAIYGAYDKKAPETQDTSGGRRGLVQEAY